MSDTPKFSIIIPVYNKEKTVARAIESVLAQTYTNFELIVINDGSIDMSLAECCKFSEKDERVRVITRENKGVAGTRQEGIDIARGEYVTFVDADDFVSANWLENIAKEKPADMYIWGYIKDSIDRTNDTLSSQIFLSNKRVTEMETTFLYPLWNKCFKKSAIEQNDIRFENIYMWEDACFVCDLLCKTENICILDEAFYHYEVVLGEETQSTDKYNPRRYVQYLTLFEHYRKFNDSHGNYIRAIQNMVCDLIYNVNQKSASLSSRQKRAYITTVLNHPTSKKILAKNINPQKIVLKDQRIGYKATRRGVTAVLFTGRILSFARRIKNGK